MTKILMRRLLLHGMEPLINRGGGAVVAGEGTPILVHAQAVPYITKKAKLNLYC